MTILFDKEKDILSLNMPYPPFLDLVKWVAEVGALLAVIVGLVEAVGGLTAFQVNFMYGITAAAPGVITIVTALAGLGFTYGFIALVKAQVDMRNAIMNGSSPAPRAE